jgi:rhamnosyltransferase
MTENQRPKSVLAVVVSFNDGPALKETAGALAGQVGKLVIVDNGSNPDTARCIVDLESTVGAMPVYLQENCGIGAALNVGIAIARKENFEWLLTMDQDSIAGPQMVSELLKCAESYGDAAAVICPTLAADETDVRHGNRVIDSAVTSGNLVRVGLFQVIGRYNESYFIDAVDLVAEFWSKNPFFLFKDRDGSVRLP